MKLITTKSTRRGIAMTEYLIILAIVAIAAIAVVGLFGKQIKNTFNRSNQALVGQKVEADTAAASLSQTDTVQDSMGSFTQNADQKD
jgi:pilus assembly protein Flp/PilA